MLTSRSRLHIKTTIFSKNSLLLLLLLLLLFRLLLWVFFGRYSSCWDRFCFDLFVNELSLCGLVWSCVMGRLWHWHASFIQSTRNDFSCPPQMWNGAENGIVLALDLNEMKGKRLAIVKIRRGWTEVEKVGNICCSKRKKEKEGKLRKTSRVRVLEGSWKSGKCDGNWKWHVALEQQQHVGEERRGGG